MDKSTKDKLKTLVIIMIISSILVALIVFFECGKEKRRKSGIEYYNKIVPTIQLADALMLDVECSDKKGNSWVIVAKNESLTSIVIQDIIDYIEGENSELYKYNIIENENILRRIDNFNDNMKHIRISGEDANGNPIPPKTIAEGEGMEEFIGVKNLDELIEYMHKLTNEGEYYLDALSLIGLDGSGYDGKIIYLYDNGEEKILRNLGRMSLFDLFEKWN